MIRVGAHSEAKGTAEASGDGCELDSKQRSFQVGSGRGWERLIIALPLRVVTLPYCLVHAINKSALLR
jgi:hypothetical protein